LTSRPDVIFSGLVGNAPDAVKRLVDLSACNAQADRFDQNRKVFLSGDYKEEPLRAEFLNPFFESLGWDGDNTLDTIRDRNWEASLSSPSLNQAVPLYWHALAPHPRFAPTPARGNAVCPASRAQLSVGRRRSRRIFVMAAVSRVIGFLRACQVYSLVGKESR
jgi:hypothetical protein